MAPRNVLFLCTGNSARSIMAEALLRASAAGRFAAFSAGSHPAGAVHPLALRALTRNGYPIGELRSKSWDEFSQPDAPVMDFVITVCDRAAEEQCPVWPGQPITAHWSFEDPAAARGDEQEQYKIFARVFQQISVRVQLFLSLPMDKLDRLALERGVRDIGRV